MSANESIGLIICGLVAVSSFAAVIIKITRPINELNLSIVRLRDSIDRLLDNDRKQDGRISEHGKQIDELCIRIENHGERLKNLERNVR